MHSNMQIVFLYWASNTVQEFQGCYYHSCPISFKPNQIVPQRNHNYKDKTTGAEKFANFQIGDLYKGTKQKVERLHQNGNKVVEMWGHEWVQYYKKNKMNPKGDPPKLYPEPLIPHGAFFRGHFNFTKMLHTCEVSELLHQMGSSSQTQLFSFRRTFWSSKVYVYPTQTPLSLCTARPTSCIS